jgi:hypothetical protein
MRTRSSTLQSVLLISALLALGKPNAEGAAVFSLVYGPSAVPVTSAPDLYYSTGGTVATWDGISRVFSAPVTTSESSFQLTGTLFGRHYDSDPTLPGEWGLLDRKLLTGFEDPSWLVKHGLPSEAVGNPEFNNVIRGVEVLQPASYVAFKVASANELLFDEANLTITGLYNVSGAIELWAATNADGFTKAIKPTITSVDSETDVYSFDFHSMAHAGKDMEVRVYGILGQDQGTFTSAVLTGTLAPFPVPEPSAAMLLGMLGGAWLIRRKPAQRSA